MAKPKIYQMGLIHTSNSRVEAILAPERGRADYIVYAVAPSKASASAALRSRMVGYADEKEWRVAGLQVAHTDALREAGLFTEGALLVIGRGSTTAVAMVDAVGYASAIGQLKRAPDSDFFRLVFEPSMAQFCRRGSIAAGAEEVYIHTGRNGDRRWAGTWGDCMDDEQMQLQLDLGNLKITRAGFGDWYHEGR